MFSQSRSILFLLLTICTGSLLRAQGSDQQLTFVRDENIILFDVDSGTETVLLEDVDPAPRGNSWSPDGSRLAFMAGDSSHQRELTVLDTSSGEIYQLAIVSEGMLDASIWPYYYWSPDGQWIAYNLHYYDPEREQEVNAFYVIAVSRESQPQLIANDRMSFKWMPDSHHILYGRSDGYYRYDIATGATEPLPIPNAEYQIWSPNGSQVLDIDQGLYVGENAFLWLYDVETGEKHYVREFYSILSANFSPDGQWIDYILDTRYWGEQMILLHKPTGQEKWLDAPRISFRIWAPDSSMMAYTLSSLDDAYPPGGTLYIFNIETGENRRIADEAFPFIGWSPDSGWLAYQTDDYLHLFDLSHEYMKLITDIDFVIGWRP